MVGPIRFTWRPCLRTLHSIKWAAALVDNNTIRKELANIRSLKFGPLQCHRGAQGILSTITMDTIRTIRRTISSMAIISSISINSISIMEQPFRIVPRAASPEPPTIPPM